MNNRIKTAAFFELFVLIQFLIISILLFRDQPRIVFANFIITITTTIIFLIFITLQKIILYKKIIICLLPFVFIFALFHNAERIYHARYYRILFENRLEFSNWEKLILEQNLIDTQETDYLINIDELKVISIFNNAVFFCFSDENRTAEGIAYSKNTEDPRHTGRNFQYLVSWGKIYGNWYFWTAHEGH
jgi:hypothetical protein